MPEGNKLMDRATFGGPMDRVLLLRSMPMFEGLGPIQLAAVAQHATERYAERDRILRLDTGERESVLLVVEGELVSTDARKPRKFGKSDAVGFVETLARIETRLELQASVDTMLLELDWDAQLDVCEEHFAVVMSYASFLASRLIERTQRVQVSELGPEPLIAGQEFGRILDLNERLLLLSRSGAFSSGCLDALSELAQQGEEIRTGPGELIWTAGQEADQILVIASGALRFEDEAGAFSIYRAGTAAGMAESLSRYNRRYTAVSIEPTVALRIHTEAFMDVLEDHFDLSLDILATLASRLAVAGPRASAIRPAEGGDAPS